MRKYMKIRRALYRLLVSQKSTAGRHQCFIGEEPYWIITEYLRIKNQNTVFARLLADVVELTVPALRERVKGSSRNRIHYSISREEVEDSFIWEVNQLKKIEDFWNEAPEVFEDFIKIMKSFRYFNMESLSDFLATNEIHDLWLIVATNKDYREESAEDRLSL